MSRKLFSILGILILFTNLEIDSWAFLDTNTVVQVQTGGSDTNGGAFVGDPEGSTGVASTFMAVAKISPPSAPTFTCVSTGGTIPGNTTYYGVISFIDHFGHSKASAQGSIVVNNANCGGNTNTNTITFVAPASASGCQSGTTCTWEGYISANNNGPWAQSFTTQTLGSNKAVTSIPALPGTQVFGVDYTQQNTAQIAVTDASNTQGSTTLTSATANFNGYDVGNTVYISLGSGSCTAGTVTTEWRQIKTVTNSTTVTLDNTLNGMTGGATCSNMTLNLGGAFASPAVATAFTNQDGSGYGMKIFVKNDGGGIYWMTTGTQNVSGGTAKMNSGSFPNDAAGFVGYTSNRTLTNTDARPTLKVCQNAVAPCTGAVNNVTVLQELGVYPYIANIIVDVNGATTSSGVVFNSVQGFIRDVKSLNSTAYGIKYSSNAGNLGLRLEATGHSGTAGIAFDGTCVSCYVHDGTTTGIVAVSANIFSSLVFSISANNSGGSSDGVSRGGGTDQAALWMNNTSYGNGRYGFNFQNGVNNVQLILNNVAEANGSAGYAAITNNQFPTFLYKNAAYNNAGSTTLANQVTDQLLPFDLGFINNTTGSFFTNAAAADFSLNSLAGQGALLRGACIPGPFPGGTTTGYIDCGAVIRQGGVTATPAGGFAGVQ